MRSLVYKPVLAPQAGNVLPPIAPHPAGNTARDCKGKRRPGNVCCRTSRANLRSNVRFGTSTCSLATRALACDLHLAQHKPS